MFADAEPAASKDTAIIMIMARAIIITIMPMITVTPTGMPAAADTIMTTHTGMTTATIMGTTITIMATITTGITATSTTAPAPQASPFRA